MIRALAVTVSNRAAAGIYADKSGPVLAQLLAEAGCEVTGPLVIPDGSAVEEALRDAVAALRAGDVPKGDALAVARIAGIQGAKRTPDLIPLCHPIGLHGVTVDLAVTDDGVDITATARTADRTGVEMEALTSVSVAALALIDMIKAVDPAAVITDVRVDEKTGGKSGPWHRPASAPASAGAASEASSASASGRA